MQFLKNQLLHLLPAFLFFFLFFNLLNITVGLMEGTKETGYFGFFSVLFASLIVAKVLALIDNLPIVDAFPKKPLFYNVTWKTLLYTVTSFLIRLLERYFLKGEYSWLTFWTVQLWFFILFLLYTIFRELTYCIGTDKVYRMFFIRR